MQSCHHCAPSIFNYKIRLRACAPSLKTRQPWGVPTCKPPRRTSRTKSPNSVKPSIVCDAISKKLLRNPSRKSTWCRRGEAVTRHHRLDAYRNGRPSGCTSSNLDATGIGLLARTNSPDGAGQTAPTRTGKTQVNSLRTLCSCQRSRQRVTHVSGYHGTGTRLRSRHVVLE